MGLFRPGFREEARIRGGMARQKTKKVPGSDPATSDKHYSTDELEFILAMQEYCERTGRRFPSWSETLAVAIKLGYRKVP